MTIAEAVAKLSPEDRERYRFDMVAYGNAMLRQNDDGSVVYVPVSEWSPHLKKALAKSN